MGSENTVVISGAGTGIGRAAAQRLALDGFHVTAVGRRRQPLDRLAAEMAGGVETITADVATAAGAASVAASVSSAGRRCAGVVAAAGGVSPGPSADGLQAVRRGWQASFESNVLTAVLLVEALRQPLECDGGRVVVLSSVAALRGSGGGPYGGDEGRAARLGL